MRWGRGSCRAVSLVSLRGTQCRSNPAHSRTRLLRRFAARNDTMVVVVARTDTGVCPYSGAYTVHVGSRRGNPLWLPKIMQLALRWRGQHD